MRIDSSGNVCVGSTAAGDAGTISLSVGLAGTTSGGLQLWASSAQEHFIQWGDATTGDATYAGAIGYSHASNFMRFYTASAERMRIDSSGNLQFNSGYGSVATAFGCRAWIVFNGTGTPSITGSGNISSISDIGTGNYRVNMTTAMPDLLFSCQGMVGAAGGTGGQIEGASNGTSEVYIYTFDRSGLVATDFSQVQFSVFR
jgi:hypothetical protein